MTQRVVVEEKATTGDASRFITRRALGSPFEVPDGPRLIPLLDHRVVFAYVVPFMTFDFQERTFPSNDSTSDLW